MGIMGIFLIMGNVDLYHQQWGLVHAALYPGRLL